MYKMRINHSASKLFLTPRLLTLFLVSLSEYDKDLTNLDTGSGPRNCIGQTMAMHEMRLFLASLVYNFDLELCNDKQAWAKQQTFALWLKAPLMCLAKPVVR